LSNSTTEERDGNMSPAIEPLYVRFQVPDLRRAEVFLNDFGMVSVARDGDRLYLRGTGAAPWLYEAVLGSESRFVGAGFRVATRSDLTRLVDLEGSSPVQAVSDAPGGGHRVRMRMADGFEIDAVHGAAETPLNSSRAPIHLNTARAKPRLNSFVRTPREPALIAKLGHFVLHVRDHKSAVAWLQKRLGLMASDYMGPPGDPDAAVGTFLRIDRGAEPVDHHCLLVLGSDKPGLHHASFEVEDIDALMAGHDHLAERGYRLDCGVGRHLLGSQIFDYWRDPFGFRIEHYTDGDRVDDSHVPSIFSGSADETTQWGARPPKDFFE
jgi:catechol 2,3-dioxygenase-like lactoylglutathione lyase family enzyme